MHSVGVDQSMFWDGFQWIPRSVGQNSQEHNATRKNRRLYVANLPLHLGMTEEMLGQQLFIHMRDRGLIPADASNPVLHVWFARDKGGSYGFVEFATLEDTEKALGLDGFNVMGVPITIKRPSDYALPILPPSMTHQAIELPVSETRPTSRIVRLVRIFASNDRTESDEFLDVIDDMKLAADRLKLRPSRILMARSDVYGSDGSVGLSAGDALVEFDELDSAEACFRGLSGKKYDGRVVSLDSVEEGQWHRDLLPILLEMNADFEDEVVQL